MEGRPGGRRLLCETAAVLTGVFVTVGLLAWPVPIRPATWWVGSSHNDHASITWTLDFVARRLAEARLPWGRTDRLEWPEGGTLLPADLPEAVLLSPLVLLLGATVAVNLLAVLHHALAAALTWGWLRREGAGPAGAAAGCMAFAFAPALVTATYNGNPDVTPWYWIPAALWVAVTPGSRRAVTAGALVALGGACNPYVGVMGGVALGARLAADRRWRDLCLGAAAVAVGACGVWLLTTWALVAPDAAIHKGPRVGLMGTATVLGLVRPAPWIIPTDRTWALPTVATGTYLGWSLLGGALLARDRRGFGWALVVVGVLAALGPELRLADALATWDPARVPPGAGGPPPVGGGTGIPLPWALVEHLPGLGRLQLTARYTGLAALGLAWLVARGVDRLPRWRWALPALVALDLLALARGAPMLRAQRAWDDGSCSALAELEPGPVVDMPPTYHELWLYASLCHGQPVAEGINRPLSVRVQHALERSGPEGAGQVLAGHGFRWLVFHRDGPGPRYLDLEAPMAHCAVRDEPRWTVYDLACAATEDGGTAR